MNASNSKAAQRAAFGIALITSDLVASDGLFDVVDDNSLGGDRGCGFDAAQAADFADGYEAAGEFGFLEDFLAVELGHAGVFGVLL